MSIAWGRHDDKQFLHDLYLARRQQSLRQMQKPGVSRAANLYWAVFTVVTGIVYLALRYCR